MALVLVRNTIVPATLRAVGQLLRTPVPFVFSTGATLSRLFNGPDTELSQPVTELSQPVTKLSEPDTEFSEPFTEFSGPFTEYNPPFTEFSETVTEYNIPFTEFSGPFTEYDTPPNEYTKSPAEPVVNNAVPRTNGAPQKRQEALGKLAQMKPTFYADRFFSTKSRFLDTDQISSYVSAPGGSSMGDNGDRPTGVSRRLEVEYDDFDIDTRELLRRLYSCSGVSKLQMGECRELRALKLVVEDIQRLHGFELIYMVEEVTLAEGEHDVSFVTRVAQHMFDDGVVTWQRIAVLLAFGATVCEALSAKGRTDCVEQVVQELFTYLVCEHKDWLLANNGWLGFAKHFPVPDRMASFKNTLLAIIGLTGVGAALRCLSGVI